MSQVCATVSVTSRDSTATSGTSPIPVIDVIRANASGVRACTDAARAARQLANGSSPAISAGCGEPGAPVRSGSSPPVAHASIWCWPQIACPATSPTVQLRARRPGPLGLFRYGRKSTRRMSRMAGTVSIVLAHRTVSTALVISI
jgi:hypothetical protein